MVTIYKPNYLSLLKTLTKMFKMAINKGNDILLYFMYTNDHFELVLIILDVYAVI